MNHTPFSSALLPSLDKEGVERLVVVTKATFSVHGHGDVRVADEQAPIVLADEHHGEPGQSSVRYESDAAPGKPGIDVIMNGTAYPSSASASSEDVELRVGPVRAAVRVFGPRHWVRIPGGGYRPSPPQRWIDAPLLWELAFGGRDDGTPDAPAWETRNPVGVGFVAPGSRRDLEGLPVPRIEDPGALLTRAGDRPAPVGFGFVARHWHPRVALAGTYDDAWRAERAPLLPLDFDERYHQAAPSLHVARHLRPGEACTATRVLPGGRSFELALPSLALDIQVVAGLQTRSLSAQLDTVLLEPDPRRVVMTYRAAVPVGRGLLAIDRVKVRYAA